MDNLVVKGAMSQHQLQLLQSEFEKKKKSTAVTWLLWLFLGGIGGHRYYLGNVVRAIFMTLTLGGLGFWALIDAFFINSGIRHANERIESQIITHVQNLSPGFGP